MATGPEKAIHTILCIDDDLVTLRVTQRILSSNGYNVVAVNDPTRGLQLAKELRPDLILLDIMMPELDGYEVCATLRTGADTAAIPVVFLTASAKEQDKARAFSLGAIDYLVKPVNGSLLAQKVDLYLRKADEWEQMDDHDSAHWSAGIQSADFLQFKDFASSRFTLDSDTTYKLSKIDCSELYSVCDEIGVSQRAMAQNVAEFLKVPYVCNINPDDIRLGVLPASFCKSNKVVATGGASAPRAYVLSNPFDLDLVDLLRKFAYVDDGSRLMITEPANIDALFVEPPAPDVETIPNEREKPVKKHIVEACSRPAVEIHSGRPESEVVEFPVIQICNSILHTAVSERASDIHVEPKETNTIVRYRVDGDMRDALTLKRVTGMKIISRLKILGDLDIAEKKKPQDGAFAAIIGGRTFNIRLSTTYTPNGESIVMRLLEPYSEPKDLRELGMAEEQVLTVLRRIRGDKGMILVVGPTGSGKTTTVYSLLHRIDTKSLSVMSVEDPVEYRIPSVNQHQVNDKAGVTFESLLKTAVRQDPDILFLGEMRDGYSAKVAVDFASTGHLTVTTLHTSDATSAIFRLERLGLGRGEMADSIAAVVAQRLVRRLCQRCREVAPISAEERVMLGPFTDDVPSRVGRPVGCQDCNYTGYYGREGVYEVIEFDSEAAAMVRNNVSIREIRSRLHAKGKGLMMDYGIAKIRGLTLAPKDVYDQVLGDEPNVAGRTTAETETPAEAPAPNFDMACDATPCSNERTPSILVVEDDQDARTRFVGWLRDGGYDISVCIDGIEALISLGKKEFDLVVTATSVANLDGFKLLEMVREKEIDVPMILTAASASTEEEERALRLGAADYIKKNTPRDVLLPRVRRALVHSRRLAGATASVEA